MSDKALEALNKVCEESGVCETAVVRTPEIKHAAELWKNSADGVRRVRVCLWQDGAITSCEAVLKDDKEIEGSCYTSEPGQEDAYWAWQSHLTSPEIGYKIKGIEVEKRAGVEPAEITERIRG